MQRTFENGSFSSTNRMSIQLNMQLITEQSLSVQKDKGSLITSCSKVNACLKHVTKMVFAILDWHLSILLIRFGLLHNLTLLMHLCMELVYFLCARKLTCETRGCWWMSWPNQIIKASDFILKQWLLLAWTANGTRSVVLSPDKHNP